MVEDGVSNRQQPISRMDDVRTMTILRRAASASILLLTLSGRPPLLPANTQAAVADLDGTLRLPGLSADVIVRRDNHGVPHIEAANESDLFQAQGYITAQDRLWQMDTYRRYAFGDMAEVFGPAQLEHDTMQRVLKIRITARRVFAAMSPSERARVDAYARGVNAYIEQHSHDLPPEFKVFSYAPHAWAGEDTIGIGLMMAQGLDAHFDAKLGRERVSAILHNPKLEADLYPVGSWRDHANVPLGKTGASGLAQLPQDARDARLNGGLPIESGAENLPALRAMPGLADCGECSVGSNNWVVAGKRTASGKPLLSNDMHLNLTIPDLWYMTDLMAPGYHVEGVTMAGIPGIIAGHNEYVAWGITGLYADVQDLYVETLDGKGNYLDKGIEWKPLEVDHEVITVRGKKNVEIDVLSTSHGPLLNPVFEKTTRPVALQWTLFDKSLHSLPIYELDTARNWKEFSDALRSWCWPTQNFVYADDRGTIAYQAAGKVPLRPNGLSGVPIKDADHEWRGYVPFEAMPHIVNPSSGFIATANSRVTPDGTAYPLSLNWGDPYRTERIYALLGKRTRLTRQDMLATQIDVYSELNHELAARFARAIERSRSVDARMQTAADLMRVWDGRMTVDSAAATLVSKARTVLWDLILKPKLGDDVSHYIWSNRNFAQEQIVKEESLEWLPPEYSNWDALLTAAVELTIDDKNAPKDVSQWSYGSWHVIDLEHPAKLLMPLHGDFTGTGRRPLAGDGTTINQEATGVVGPSQRFTMDWGDADGSTENLVVGESGNPMSPYFGDQWKYWYGGTTISFPFSKAAIREQTRHTLLLQP